MRIEAILFIVIGSLCGSAAPSAASDFAVEGFGLGIIVDDAAPNRITDSFNTIQNPSLLVSPFIAQHMVTLPSSPNSTVSASYTFVWDENTGGVFHVAGNLSAAEPMSSILFSRSSGQINFAASGGADLLLDMHAVYSFVLPPMDFRAWLTYSVRDLDTGEFLFGGTQLRDSFFSNTPVVGSFVVDGMLPLAAGRRAKLEYAMRLSSLGGNVGAVATGSGTIDLAITVVPQPASLVLWGMALLALRRRGRRR